MRPSLPVLAAVSSLTGALLGAVVALLLGVVRLDVGPPPPVPAPGPAVSPAVTGEGPRDEERRPGELRQRRDTVAALGVLRRWDERRARAWTRGEAALLRPLYTRSSLAGRRDVALLRQYAERGLSVRGLRPQVVSARASTRTDDRVVVRVVERYPDEGSHVRVVSLVGSPTGWRVARVTGG